MNKKKFAKVAMIVSLVLVFFGFLMLCGAMGGNTSSAYSSYTYDSGYASFGADFYTYVSNNAAEAASASRTAANNLDDIATLLKGFGGIFLMGYGLLNFCNYGMIVADLGGFKNKKDKAAAAEAVAAPCECAPVEVAPVECEAVENEQ